MKIQAKSNPVSLYLDDSDSGEGLAIFLSQDLEALARWRLEVFAKTDGDSFLVGEITTSPPSATRTETGNPAGKPTRQVAVAVCPGAKSWSVLATALIQAGFELTNESADITLASSKCCTAPAGLTRVSERYDYRSGDTTSGATTFRVAPGRTVTGIGVIGLAPGGTIQIGVGADVITVPTGMTFQLEPKAPIAANTPITFANALWTVEYLESA